MSKAIMCSHPSSQKIRRKKKGENHMRDASGTPFFKYNTSFRTMIEDPTHKIQKI